MNRTINERKAVGQIFWGSSLSYLGIIGFGLSVRKPTIIIGSISIICMFTGWLIGLFGAYGLGWEFKRIQIEEAKQ